MADILQCIGSCRILDKKPGPVFVIVELWATKGKKEDMLEDSS